jgi:hypothetical protein
VKFRKDTPKILMQKLIYPAFWGTALVLFTYKIFQHSTFDLFAVVANWWGLWALIHFALSYLANERWISDYNWKTFFADLLEVMILVLSFKFLGFSNMPATNPNFRFFYLTFLFSPIGQFLWTKFLSKDKIPRDLYFILPMRFTIYLLGMIFNNKYLGYDVSAIILSFGLTIWYLKSDILFE